MIYQPVIGLEVHVELNTKSKMFCRCSADYFGKQPNTHTCPVCLGLPGSLPYTNKAAIQACIKIGLALGCNTSEEAVFERKNYFYPDLPKGFQISQYRWPLCKNGLIEVTGGNEQKRKIRINRVHMEEDTGKMFHSKDATLIDFNRSGVPLVEIVTEPDFQDTIEIKDYARKLQQLFRYLGVSGANMERGDMRLEANVSLRRQGDTKLPSYRVELKNINSFRFMVAAVEYEIKRQTEALEDGQKLINETRGWDENKKQTFTQRVKETADDYRYFPEPDLPPIKIDKETVTEIEKQMPELPWEKAQRFVQEYSLSTSQAAILTETREVADYFEEGVRVGRKHDIGPARIANTLINKKFNREEILPAKLVEMLREEAGKPKVAEKELDRIVTEVLEENPGAVADYKKGKENALQFLVGQIMGKTHGQADPDKAKELLMALL